MFIFKKEFTTIEELIAFNNSLNGSDAVPPIIPLGATQAAPKKGGKKATVVQAPVAPSTFGQFPAANEMQQVPSPFNPGTPTTAAQQYQAPLAAPAAPAYVPPAPAQMFQPASVNGQFNREGAVQEVRTLMANLEAVNGFTQEHAATEIGNLYAQAQCQLGTPISQLDDASLQRFLPLFRARVGLITGSQVQQAPAQAHSFV